MTEAIPPVPTLESPRLRLRPFTVRDVDDLFAMHGDPVVMRYWSYPAYTERAQAEAKVESILADMRAREVYPWAIADRATDRLLGQCALFALERAHARCEVGYALSRAAQGQGMASEAVRCALTHAFDTLGMERIEADVDPRNAPSVRLLERLGFQREGLLRARWRVSGEVQDAYFYGLLRAEFVR